MSLHQKGYKHKNKVQITKYPKYTEGKEGRRKEKEEKNMELVLLNEREKLFQKPAASLTLSETALVLQS